MSAGRGAPEQRPSGEIRELNPDNRNDVATVAKLHLALFRDIGPMAQLGERFVRDFCYSTLIRDGLIRAALYEVDGEPAGMVAYTDRSISFHRSAIRNHWPYVGWLVLLSVLRNPGIVIRLARAARLMFSRRAEQEVLGEDPMAEVLAIGVLPEYRRPEFARQTGLRIAEELQDYVIDFFRGVGLSTVRMIVDEDNKPALLHWHRIGGTFEPCIHGGKPSVQIWLDLSDERN
jgi:ribosomal protein S18 acetylase RimI-like enzyme